MEYKLKDLIEGKTEVKEKKIVLKNYFAIANGTSQEAYKYLEDYENFLILKESALGLTIYCWDDDITKGTVHWAVRE